MAKKTAEYLEKYQTEIAVLLAERSAVRAAAIDEMVKKLGDETWIDERVSLRHIQEVAKWLKEAQREENSGD